MQFGPLHLCAWPFPMSFATNFYVAYASDPSPLQDFCVGVNDPNSRGKFYMEYFVLFKSN